MRKHAYPYTDVFYDGNSFADFTYTDDTGAMAAILEIPVKGHKKFHIEVKTSKGAENGFAFSSRQLNTVLARVISLIVDAHDVQKTEY